MPSHYSGIERAAEGLYARLTELGHGITVYCRRGNPEYDGDEYRGVRLVYTPSIALRFLETLSHAAASLAHALFCGRFDVIYLHALAPGLFSFIRRISRVPVVATITVWTGRGLNGRVPVRPSLGSTRNYLSLMPIRSLLSLATSRPISSGHTTAQLSTYLTA